MRVLLWTAAALGVVVIAIGAYGIWFVRRAVTSPPRVRVVVAKAGPKTVDVKLVSSGGGSAVLTEITVPVSVQQQLGLEAPAGFRVEPLRPERGEEHDRDALSFIEKFNRENVRYVGTLPLPANSDSVVSFPALRPGLPTARISFQYEQKVGFGGAIASADLDPPK